MTRVRAAIAAIVLGASLVGCGGGSDDAAPVPTGDDFLAVTDCRELEQLAAAEVDRINSTTDGDIVAAATARFQRIVEHRDSICS